MDIIIKGIDITDDIDFVEITTYSLGMPRKTIGKDIDQVIRIPKDHGRLIDENMTYIDKTIDGYFEIYAPTILEAEE